MPLDAASGPLGKNFVSDLRQPKTSAMSALHAALSVRPERQAFDMSRMAASAVPRQMSAPSG